MSFVSLDERIKQAKQEDRRRVMKTATMMTYASVGMIIGAVIAHFSLVWALSIGCAFLFLFLSSVAINATKLANGE